MCSGLNIEVTRCDQFIENSYKRNYYPKVITTRAVTNIPEEDSFAFMNITNKQDGTPDEVRTHVTP